MKSSIVTPYSPSQFDSAVDVLASAFVTNPLHLAVFGEQEHDQNCLFFKIGLKHFFTSQAFVVLKDGQVQGYMHFKSSPSCLPPPEQV